MTHKTAIIYLRVSSAQQARNDLPIESQLQYSQSKAKELGAVVVAIFTDNGISGRTAKRADFQEAIAYCEEHRPDYFIAWDTSRFARNRMDALLYKKKLRDEGTDVVYVSMSIDTKTDEGWMMEAIFEVMDENTSRRISKDTKRSMVKNAEDGFFNGGRVPFGYQLVKEGQRKRMAVLENEAAIVRQMFSLCEGGMGAQSIAVAMNNMGHFQRGRKWVKSTVIYLLKSHVYAGFSIFNRRKHHATTFEPEENWIRTKSHPAIIDEEIFMKIQKLITNRAPAEGSGSPKSTHMFTGILKCGLCGSAMHIESSTGRSKQYHYYRCGNAKRGFDCEGKRISAPEIDAFLAKTILDKILTKERVTEIIREIEISTSEWWKNRRRRREATVAEIRAAEGKRSRIFDIMEIHGKDTPDIKELSMRLGEIRSQIEALEASLLVLESEEDPILNISEADIVSATASLRLLVTEESSVATARTFFSSFVKKIVIEAEQVVIKYDPAKIMNHESSVVHSKNWWLPEHILSRTIRLVVPFPSHLNWYNMGAALH